MKALHNPNLNLNLNLNLRLPAFTTFTPPLRTPLLRRPPPPTLCPIVRRTHTIPPHRPPRHPPKSATTPPPPPKILHDKTVHTPSNLPTDTPPTVPVTLKCEHLGGRRRKISGSITIPATLPRVWTVITSYSKMPLYLPNILSTTAFTRNKQTHIEQIGLISRKLSLRSRVLLRVTEERRLATVRFSRVEGRDFLHFEGVYVIRGVPDDDKVVRLDYEVVAIPFPFYPMAMVEGKVLKEVPRMLAAIRDEAVLARHIPNNTS